MPLKVRPSKTYHHVVGVRSFCGKCLLLVFHHSVISVGIIMVESYFHFVSVSNAKDQCMHILDLNDSELDFLCKHFFFNLFIVVNMKPS